MNNWTLLSVLILVVCVKQMGCDQSSSCSRHLQRPEHEYHLTKECAESYMRIVASSNASKLESCVQLAATQNAFAFTYANITEGSMIIIIFNKFYFGINIGYNMHMLLKCIVLGDFIIEHRRKCLGGL